jgi:MoxR-like ATPase
MSKATAYSQGRDYVIPDDVYRIIDETLAHRIILRPGSEDESITTSKILQGIVKSISTPRVR